MKKTTLRLVSLTVLFIVVITGGWKAFNSIETKSEYELEGEEEHEKESGAAEQLSGWFQSKGYPNPENLSGKYENAWQQYLEIKKNTFSNGHQTRVEGVNSNWTSLGDVSSIGGRVLCVKVDPNNSNIVWAGSASGGIWKSINAGSSWTAVSTNLPVLGVSSIIVDPTNSNIIYAGTGEVYRVDTSNIGFSVWKTRGTYGIGIIKSTDGGATWTQVMTKVSSQLFAIQMLKFDPTNSNTIYACATDGLYRSTNSGGSWSQILNKIYVSDVAINPSNNDQIVVGVGNMVNLDKGIYRTTNGTVASPTWSKIASGLPSSFMGYIRFAQTGTSDLFASIGLNGNTSGNELYQSTNFGSSWTAKSGSNHCNYQHWFSHAAAVDPNNTTQLLICGVSWYKYNSGTSSRSNVSTAGHADVHNIEYDPNISNTIYVACDGGVYKSTNGGTTFTAINTGLRATQFYASFGVHPSSANVMIGGLQDNGVVRYNGTSWSTAFGGDGGPSAIAPNGTTVIASNDARSVRRSTTGTTGGFSTVLSSWAFSADDRTAFMAPIAISKSDGNYMYVASDNIHRSTNGGGAWSNSATSSTNYIEQHRKTAIAIAVSPTNRNKIYVSTSNIAQNTTNDLLWVNGQPNVFKTTTPATTPYTSIKGSLPNRFIMDFAISENDDDSVYIAVGGFGTSHVYLTPDGGVTWLSRGSGLPDVPFNAVLIDPVDPKIIYAGGDFGVYVSPDRGLNWFDYNTNFYDATLVMDLQLDANNKLIAATHGKGVFRSDLYTPPITLPVTFTSFTGYNRNEFNDLKWNVEQEYSLDHYEVERSIDGFNFQTVGNIAARNLIDPSTYTFNDNIRNVGSSTYYYRLKAININGSYFYSDIVFIKINGSNSFKIIGNPFTDKVSFRYSATEAGKMNLQLLDMQGRVLRKEEQNTIRGSAVYTINNLTTLPKGMYILEIRLNRERFSEKILKR